MGGGSTGIAFSADMVSAGHQVTLFEQELWGANLKEIESAGYIRRDGYGPQGSVKAPYIIFDPHEAIADAEIIFVTLVANRHKEVCRLIAPYMKDGQAVCFFSGNCGSIVLKKLLGRKKILVGETVGSYTSSRYRCNALVHYAMPVSGPKAVAAFPASDNKRFAETISTCYPCVSYPDTKIKNVFEAALNAPNVAVHLIASILCVSAMERSNDFRLYRDGLTPSVIKLIGNVEKERDAVFTKFGYQGMSFTGMMQMCYDFEKNPIPKLEGFWLTTGPSDVSHRYISEDAYAGDSLLISMARLAGVETPLLCAAVSIASALNDTDYYSEGLTLESLGLNGIPIQQINDYLQTGTL